MATALKISANMTVDQALGQITQAYPDREAIICGQERITYHQVADQISRFSSAFHSLGIRKGDKVGLILPGRPEFVYALFALTGMGAVVVPINPQLQRRELHHILSDSEAVAVITLARAAGSNLAEMMANMRAELPGLRHVIVAGEEKPEGSLGLRDIVEDAAGVAAERSPVDPDDLAGLIYTSGTTGLPKGSMHTHRNLIAPVIAAMKIREAWMPKPNVESMVRLAKLVGRYRMRLMKAAGKQQTFLGVTNYHGIGGVELIMQILLGGDRMLLMEKFHPVEVLKLIEKEKVSILTAPPTFLSVLLRVQDFDEYDLSSLLVCGTGEAMVPPQVAHEIQERIGCAVTISFGATELGGSAIVTDLFDSNDVQAETVGRPLPGVEAKVVDEERNELPRGEVGELAVRVGKAMKGYYKAPEATAAVMDEQGWYYTGDMATMDENGYFRIVGRKKDMIKRGGQNIYPAEVEKYLLTNPKIAEVAVVGVPAPLGNENAWAYVVPTKGTDLTALEVVEYCRGQIAAYKIPDEIRFVSELPRAHGAKVQKFKLRELAMAELQARLEKPDLERR